MTGAGKSAAETTGDSEEESSGSTEEIVDQTGRVLGARAQGTRQRLLDATKALLEEQHLRDLRVIDIARRLDASPATFYQYFKDVEHAVLCLAERATNEMPAILELLEGNWDGKAGLDRARGIVDAFITHWDDHHAVLRARNLASDEGDERYRAVRTRAMGPVLEGLTRLFERSQLAGKISSAESAPAAAAAMASILERLAAYHRELESIGVSREDLVETSARILHRTVTGEILP